MAYSAVPTRSSSDPNSAADVNQLQENITRTRNDWIGTVYAITANYTITDTDGYGKIFVNSTGGDITVTLPTLADNLNRTITIVCTHQGGKITIDGEGGETLNGQNEYYLMGQYDRITVIAQSSEWYVIEYYAHYDTGYINNSDWTNRHLGTSAFDYDNLSGGPFTVGELITEATSGNTGVIQSDSGSTLYVKNVTGTGIWTNNRQITGSSSGATADVNEASGSNKNQDTDVLHDLNRALYSLHMKLIISSDGTDSNSFEVKDSSVGANVHGQTMWYVDADNIKVQTATDGLEHTQDNGANGQIDTEDWYYKVIVEARI